VEDIDYRAPHGLDKTVMRALAKDSAWVRNHENIFVIGPCGVGKSFLASALAQKAGVELVVGLSGCEVEHQSADAVGVSVNEVVPTAENPAARAADRFRKLLRLKKPTPPNV
jgi:ABC-type cobalamin transport system ATPase subunit